MKIKNFWQAIALCGFVVVGALIVGANNVFADTTYNVTPSSACTLADAITASNTDTITNSCPAGGANNTINLAAGIYTLGANLPTIVNNPLTIVGAGQGQTTIDGVNTFSVFAVSSDTVSIKKLTAVNPLNYAFNLQGNGTTNLSDVVVNGSTSGGGIFSTETTTNVDRMAIINTHQTSDGALFFSAANATMTVSDSTIANNTGNGAVEYSMAAGGHLNLINDTIANNTNGSPFGMPAGIGSFSVGATPSNSSMSLVNTILANNVNTFGGNTHENCVTSGTIFIFTVGAPVSLGHNISDDGSCSAAFTSAGDRNSTNPQLGTLSVVNGTSVFPITSASPAYSAADVAASPALDQRGLARPQCGTYDVGAYELGVTCSSSPAAKASGLAAPNTGLPHKSDTVSSLLVLLGIGMLVTGLRHSRAKKTTTLSN